MALLSYKEFMEEVRTRLRNLSTEDIGNLILGWAREEHPSKRQEFLDKLTPPQQKKRGICNTETLMDEIEAFAQRVEDGEYCNGWGWDDAIHEERDWGDESWAEEMDGFFLQARSLLMQGKNKLAEEVFRRLFDILEMGQEPGHLPGDPDHSNMLKADMDEQIALFLRSVYMKWCKDEIGHRIDAIVSNQHRGSYHKAVGLLVAMAETLANRDEKQDGIDLIEIYKNKYPRHTAFKGELTQALQASGLFDIGISKRGVR